MDSQEVVSRTVRVYMAAHDETQEALALALGVARSTITQKLSGRIRWTLSDLERLRGHYGVAVPALLEGRVLEALGVKPGEGRPLARGHGRRGPREEVRRPASA